MARTEILLIDADERALTTMAHGLDRRGFSVATAHSGTEALEKVAARRPALVLSEAVLPDLDGLSLCDRLQAQAGGRVPFFLLTSLPRAELSARARGRGVDEILEKPIHVSDVAVLARLATAPDPRACEGTLEELRLPYLLRALVSGERSGRIDIADGDGAIVFRDGRIVEAHYRHLRGEHALLRMFTLTSGAFGVQFEPVLLRGSLDFGLREVLLRGFPHVRRWEQVLAQLCPLGATLEVDFAVLARELDTLPDPVNRVVRLFDGRRSLVEVVDGCGLDDLTALEVVAKLEAQGIVRRSLGRAAPEGEPALFELPVLSEAPAQATGPAAEALLAELFGDRAPPADRTLPCEAVDWYADYVKGQEAWGDILPGEESGGWTESSVGNAGRTLLLTAAIEGALDEALTEGPELPRDELSAPPALEARQIGAAAAGPAPLPPAAAPVEAAPIAAEEPTVPAAATVSWTSLSVATFPETALEPAAAPAPVAAADLDEAFFAAPPRDSAAVAEPSISPVLFAGGAAGAFLVVALAAVALGGSPATLASLGSVRPGAIPAPAASVAAATDPLAATAAAPAVALEPVAFPDDPGVLAVERATGRTLAAAAQQLADAGQLGGAARKAEDALSILPDDPTVALLLGTIRLDAADTAGAAWALEQARSLDPASARTVVLLGAVYQELGERAMAREAYRTYLALDPEGESAGDVRAVLRGL